MKRKEYNDLLTDPGHEGGFRTPLIDTFSKDLEEKKVSIRDFRISCSKEFLPYVFPFLERNELSYRVYRGNNFSVKDEVILYITINSNDPKKEIKEMAMIGGFVDGAKSHKKMREMIKRTEELMKLDLETVKVIVSIIVSDSRVNKSG